MKDYSSYISKKWIGCSKVSFLKREAGVYCADEVIPNLLV